MKKFERKTKFIIESIEQAFFSARMNNFIEAGHLLGVASKVFETIKQKDERREQLSRLSTLLTCAYRACDQAEEEFVSSSSSMWKQASKQEISRINTVIANRIAELKKLNENSAGHRVISNLSAISELERILFVMQYPLQDSELYVTGSN